MRFIPLTLLFSLTLILPLRAAPATDEIPALIQQLSHDDWKLRQKAQERLVAIGEPAVDALKKISADTKDEEVRARAEAALQQIADTTRTGPTLITLHVKDATIQSVLDELSKQAKVEITLWPPNMPQQFQGKVTLDADRQPFWMVVRQLCEQTGLGLERSGQRHRITLVQRSEPWSKRPYSAHGVFLVVANSLQRNHNVDFATPDNVSTNFSMHLYCLVDPKAKVIQGTTMVHLDEVVDERGNSLVPQGNRFAQSMASPGWGSNWMWDIHAPLQHRPDMGKRIASFRGSLRFLVQEKTDVWEIDDIQQAKSPERAVNNVKYTITGFRKAGDRAWELQIGVEHDGAVPPNLNPLTDFASIQRGIRILDAAGNPFEQSGGGGGGGGGRLQYTINFHRPPDPRNQPAAEPAKLIWEIPTELKEVTVPIHLRDLPIP